MSKFVEMGENAALIHVTIDMSQSMCYDLNIC